MPTPTGVVWSADLTVGRYYGGSFAGCDELATSAKCTDRLTTSEVSFGGRDRPIIRMYVRSGGTSNEIKLTLGAPRMSGDEKTAFKTLRLRLGDKVFPLSSFNATHDSNNYTIWNFNAPPGLHDQWTEGTKLRVQLIGPDVPNPPVSNAEDVKLDVQVAPGDRKLTARWTMDRALKGDTALRSYEVQYKKCYHSAWTTHGGSRHDPTTREATRVINGLSPGTIYDVRVRFNAVSWNGAGGKVTTGPWFEAAGATRGGGTGGATRAQCVGVSLSAAPNPVTENNHVFVTVTLSEARSQRLSIPLKYTDVTAEPGDYSKGDATVEANNLSATYRILANPDDDSDDETFKVALDPARLPVGMTSLSSPITITIEDDDEVQGQSAGVTLTLTAAPNPVTEGAPVTVTATLSAALSRDVTIPLTLTDDTAEAGDRGTLASLLIPAGGTSASGQITTAVDADSEDETFTVAVDVANMPGELAAVPPPVTVTITDGDNLQNQETESPGTEGAVEALSAPHAALIRQVREWRDDPKWSWNRAHTDRWDRVLLAFGLAVPDASLTAMDAAEAQTYADRGWTRWVAVAAALLELESGADVPPHVDPDAPAEPEVTEGPPDELEEPDWPAEAPGAPVPDPVVTVTAGSAVTEGAAAGFTLTATPAPAADLAVEVSVSQRGAFAQASALGTRTVTIPAGTASAAFAVATVDDSADEPDGGIVATLASGSGYTLGAAARATVKVVDNDEPLPAIVTKRSIGREGTDAAVVFTVRLSHASRDSVFVDYETADGAGTWAGTPPARAGADYTATTGTLTFAAGQTVNMVSVPPPRRCDRRGDGVLPAAVLEPRTGRRWRPGTASGRG